MVRPSDVETIYVKSEVMDTRHVSGMQYLFVASLVVVVLNFVLHCCPSSSRISGAFLVHTATVFFSIGRQLSRSRGDLLDPGPGKYWNSETFVAVVISGQ